MDIGSIFIGVGIGIILQRFFNITKMIAEGMKQYQAKQKKLTEAKKQESKDESNVKQYD